MSGKIIMNLAISIEGYIADKSNGGLIDHFVKANVIDEYIVGIIPTIFGKGRPLFLGNNLTIQLYLDKYTVSDGIAVFHYSKR